MKGGTPWRTNETRAVSPAQTDQPLVTVADGGRETGRSREAVALHEPLRGFLRQGVHEHTARAESFQRLQKILGP